MFSFIVMDIGDGAKTSVSPANTLRVVPEFVTDTTALKSPEGYFIIFSLGRKYRHDRNEKGNALLENVHKVNFILLLLCKMQ